MTEVNLPSFILITGQAGAGHSTALKILEDEGYVTVDNLPMALVDQLVAIEVETGRRKLAICIDARTSGFDKVALERLITNSKSKFGDAAKVIHLSASRNELARRYQSTRRTHPLAKNNVIEEAILFDQEQMFQILPFADVAIDTTSISPTALRQALLDGLQIGDEEGITVELMSFAYKNGVPDNADYVFDVRFLRNPHWEPELREKTGEDKSVMDYITSDQGFEMFFEPLKKISELVLERARKDGRPYVRIAFGCTGGKHRSVAVSKSFALWLSKDGHNVSLVHRELAL